VSRLTSRRAAALSIATLAALATLSGCGALHPGVAVQAGDEKFSLQQVDEITRDVCTVIQSDAGSAGAYAMESIRRGVVRSLALRSAAEQLAVQYDVEPGTAYNAVVKQYDSKLTAVSDSEREHAVTVLAAADYIQGVLNAIGTAELTAAGVTVDEAAAAAKGGEILKAWTVEHGIEVDPRFDLVLGDTGLESVHTDTSYALSDFATQAGADQPSAEFVAALPQSQRCGQSVG
jgi:hypothetical protein